MPSVYHTEPPTSKVLIKTNVSFGDIDIELSAKEALNAGDHKKER